MNFHKVVRAVLQLWRARGKHFDEMLWSCSTNVDQFFFRSFFFMTSSNEEGDNGGISELTFQLAKMKNIEPANYEMNLWQEAYLATHLPAYLSSCRSW